jgi:hypothetical protein
VLILSNSLINIIIGRKSILEQKFSEKKPSCFEGPINLTGPLVIKEPFIDILQEIYGITLQTRTALIWLPLLSHMLIHA